MHSKYSDQREVWPKLAVMTMWGDRSALQLGCHVCRGSIQEILAASICCPICWKACSSSFCRRWQVLPDLKLGQHERRAAAQRVLIPEAASPIVSKAVRS